MSHSPTTTIFLLGNVNDKKMVAIVKWLKPQIIITKVLFLELLILYPRHLPN